MTEILHLPIILDFSEFVDQHRFWCHRAGYGPAGFRLSPFPLPPPPKNFLHTVDVKLGISTSTVCKKFLSEGGGGKGISESRLVHILHDDIKICVDPQIQRRLGLFPNVIFLSHNFILTIYIASPT